MLDNYLFPVINAGKKLSYTFFDTLTMDIRRICLIFSVVALSFCLKNTLNQDRVKKLKFSTIFQYFLTSILLMKVYHRKINCKVSNKTVINWFCRIKAYSRNHVTFELGGDLIRPYNKGLVIQIKTKKSKTLPLK